MIITESEKYEDLIETPKFQQILENIPQGATKIEKAYYVYLELGKILNESPHYVYAVSENKRKRYNDKITDDGYGICKSISELYVAMLKDERVGVEAESVRADLGSDITHVDTILKIDCKIYYSNLISDLSRIKTTRRVNSFCQDLDKHPIHSDYRERLEAFYGQKISSLTREEIEQMDKKFGYSFSTPRMRETNERGFYTEDTLAILRRDFDNPELVRKHVLPKDNDENPIDVKPEEILKYKLDYIFEHINALTDFKGQGGYLETIRYYMKVAEKLLTRGEASRLKAFAVVENGNMENIRSIIKVNMALNPGEPPRNVYYRFSKENKKYEEMTLEQTKEMFEGLENRKLKIIGVFDRGRNVDNREMRE